jgi:3-deoxy-manno-octulosonate cytidylyltransferase (CMP-KDO synthetase)
MDKVAIIIPARYGSRRLQGKPLLKLGNKTIVQHVYENAKASRLADRVIVATDDRRIYEAVRNFGGECRMTPKGIKSGSDRIAYVAKDIDNELIMNLQGDEPFLKPSLFDRGLELALSNKDIPVVTLAAKIKTIDELDNPNNVKVVVDKHGYALYFSRFPIPFIRDDKGKLVKKIKGHYRHIGIYIFRRKVLLEFVSMKQSALEKMEMLEQLRLLENGYRIMVAVTGNPPAGIDTAEDLIRAQAFFMKKRKVL